MSQPLSTPEPTVGETVAGARPRRARRVATGVVGTLACLLPTVWTLNFVRMLATGELSDHRFHQLTGQGLLLTATWLLALAPLVVAGVRGRRAPTAAALLHLAFIGVGLACAAVAPLGGAPALMVLISVTGALVWLALPLRPRLRTRVEVAPATLAAALLLSAAVAPYAVDQLALQRAATGYHAEYPHYFDMAWLVLTFAVVGVVAGLVAAARRLALVGGAGAALTGVAMLALDEGVTTGTLLSVTGLLLCGAWALGRSAGKSGAQRGA